MKFGSQNLPVGFFLACMLFGSISVFAQDRALLIGINNYMPSQARAHRAGNDQPARWSNLEGAVNDVRAMNRLLGQRFGMSSDDIVTLVDQQATRDAILQAVETELIEHAVPGKRLLFFYSGHGSRIRVPQQNGESLFHETIVPADSWQGAPDIPDKLLRQLFNRVLDAGAELVIILDSCHSGGATRGDGVRSLPEATQTIEIPEDYGDLLEKRGGIQILAAQASEYAREWQPDDGSGEHMGAFTHLLIQELMRDPLAPLSQVVDRVRGLLQAYGYLQNPMFSAASEYFDAPIFPSSENGTIAEAVPQIMALERTDGDLVRLFGGVDIGLYPGSRVVLPAPSNKAIGASDRTQTEQGLVLEVIESEGLTHSLARPVNDLEVWPELPGWTVVEYFSGPPIAPLTVWLGEAEPSAFATVEDDLLHSLGKLAGEINGMIVTDNPQDADIKLSKGPGSEDCFLWEIRNRRGLLSAIDEVQMPCHQPEHAQTELEADLNRLWRMVSVDSLLLASSSRSFPYALRVRTTTDDQKLPTDTIGLLEISLEAAQPDKLKRDLNFDPGGPNRFFYLWAIEPDLGITRICPQPDQGNCRNARVPEDDKPPVIPLASLMVDEPTSIVLFGIFSTTPLRASVLEETRAGLNEPFDLRERLFEDERMRSSGRTAGWHTEIIPVSIGVDTPL